MLYSPTMKTLLTINITFLLGINLLFAQVAINTDGSLPDSSAMLDIQSDSMGVLIPRMTTVQRDAIVNPAEWLMVICSDCAENGSISIFLNCIWTLYSWCIMEAPAIVTHVISPGQIVCNIDSVPGALGYKAWTKNNYGLAHDIGSSTTATEASAGWYWQFNRKQGYKHDGTSITLA